MEKEQSRVKESSSQLSFGHIKFEVPSSLSSVDVTFGIGGRSQVCGGKARVDMWTLEPSAHKSYLKY